MVNPQKPLIGKPYYARFMKGNPYLLVGSPIICGEWANFAAGT
jgi:hypothetical protein